ncbi:MAG: histidine--tRNA ligase [Patescibacteria group bacterium]
MANTINTSPLSGYMELLPSQQRLFNQMLDTIRSVYEENGFIPMDQPVIDRSESLLANVGGDTTKELIRIARDDDKELALRFDLTVPLARFVANNYNSLSFPFRRYAIGKVYRGERAQAGRFREFYQCDVDIVGNETLSLGYDADIILLMARVFQKLNIGDFEIRINNRKILNGLFACLNIATGQRMEVLRVLDKKEKLSEINFKEELSKLKITDSQIEVLLQFGKCKSLESWQDYVDSSDLLFDDGSYLAGVEEIKQIFNILKQSALGSNTFIWDPSIARGLDYYTGTVFETRLLKAPEIGSICSGGRYDDLAQAYTSRSLPGVGTSIGLTRLFDQLLKKEIIVPSAQQSKSQVLIIPLTKEYAPALMLQDALLAQSIACEISFAESKLDKRMNYADKLGIPFVVIIGEDEIANQKYTLRNMADGSEQKLSTEAIIKTLLREISGSHGA